MTTLHPTDESYSVPASSHTSALLPCPFCGAPADGPRRVKIKALNWAVECSMHCCLVQWYKTAEKAVAAWNRRAPSELTASSAGVRQEGDVRSTGGWRPIASAPKDGTEIILYIPDGKDGNRSPRKRVLAKWWSGDWLSRETWNGTPTYWQPLPEPPHED